MAKNKVGFYDFEDGTRIWCYGMDAMRKKAEEKAHGKLVRFTPAN